MAAPLKQVMAIVAWQFAAAFVIAVAFLPIGADAAGSSLIGGLIFVVANGYGLLRPVSHLGSVDTAGFWNLFVRGQLGKLWLTGAGFAAAFAGAPFVGAAPAPMFAAFAGLAGLNIVHTHRLSRALTGAPSF